MIRRIITKRFGINLLKGLIYWLLVLVAVRSLATGIIIEFNIREKLDSIAAVAPYFWVDMLDMLFYFCSGMLLAAIFRTDTLVLAFEVWVIEATFWLIVAYPFADVGEDIEHIYATPYTPLTNALASYVVVPACVVLGAAVGRKLLTMIQGPQNNRPVEDS